MIQPELKERFKKLKESLREPELWQRYQSDLKEEGIKAMLVVPLLVEHLGFSNIDDLKFEDVQGNNQGFADIVLKDNFLIETKKFNLLSDASELERAEKQTKKYIRNERDKIYYGLLTDGVQWRFYVDKKFIIQYGNDGQDLSELEDDCPMVLTFNIAEEQFLNLLQIFNTEDYDNSVKKTLVKAVVSKLMSRPGRFALSNMFARLDNLDIEGICGKIVQEQIDEHFRLEKGEFFEELKADKKLLKSQLKFEDEFVILQAAIVQNGHIKVDWKNCKLKMERQIEAFTEYPNLIEYLKLWQQSDKETIYPSRVALYKSIKGNARLRNQDEMLKKWIQI